MKRVLVMIIFITICLLVLWMLIKNNHLKLSYSKKVENNQMLAEEGTKQEEPKSEKENKIENNTTSLVQEEDKKENKVESKINSSTTNTKQSQNKVTTNTTEKEKKLSSLQETKKETVFTSSKIPQSILKKMIGNSIPKKSQSKVNTDNLSYLKITYWGFDDKTHVGEMIVNKKLAQEVLAIFKEVYQKKYPIQKIKLIDDYGANDEKSMRDNNTSAFCYRVIANTNTLSNHSNGTAIDINPLYNPYVVGNYISPTTGIKYVNRNLKTKGIIKKGDDLYNAFIRRGWTWGGNWKSKKDYQHFEKSV